MFNVKKLLATFLIFCFVSCATLGAGGNISPEVEKNYTSFGMIYVVSAKDNEKIISLGTAFAYDKDTLISAAHVCMGFIESGMNGHAKKEIYLKYYDPNTREVYGHKSIFIEAVDFENDVCLLKKENHNLTPAKLAKNSQLKMGEKIYVLGAPGGFFPVLTEGRYMLNSMKHIRELHKDKILISCRVFFGNSGGPVINEDGEVIGVAVAVIVRYDQLTLVTPIEHVKELIEQNGEQ